MRRSGGYRNGRAVRHFDIGRVQDSGFEDLRNCRLCQWQAFGFDNGFPRAGFRTSSGQWICSRHASGSSSPHAANPLVDMKVALDQTVTIRASVRDTEKENLDHLGGLVILVVGFLSSARRGGRRLFPALPFRSAFIRELSAQCNCSTTASTNLSLDGAHHRNRLVL